MKLEVYKEKFAKILYQRNILLPICILLACSQLLSIICLFFKNTRTIVIPGHITKEFWVDKASVSPSYLEQTSIFLANLLLTKSPVTASEQRNIVLRHTVPEFFGILQRDLILEEQKMQKDQISYVFYPVNTKINLGNLSVLLIGDKVAFVGSKIVERKREGYRFFYIYNNGRLFLNSLIQEFQITGEG